MNLFILSLSPKKIAQYMMDKHISKILLEAVQMLCSAKRILTPDDVEGLYKMAHVNHPTTIWIRTSYENFVWTLNLVEEMHKEWKYRYDHPPEKMHKSYLVYLRIKSFTPEPHLFPKAGLTPFALAMPDEYIEASSTAVEAYRLYYQSPEKQRFASWKKRGKPSWYQSA